MKTVWKVLGLTALAASLTPYRVTTDEETGDVKLRALSGRAPTATVPVTTA